MLGDFLFDECQKFRFSQVWFDYVLLEWRDVDNNYAQMVETLALTNASAVFVWISSECWEWLLLQRSESNVHMSHCTTAATSSEWRWHCRKMITLLRLRKSSFKWFRWRAWTSAATTSCRLDACCCCTISLMWSHDSVMSCCFRRQERWSNLVKRMVAASMIDLQRG